MSELAKIFATAAGIGGIGAFVLLMLYRQWMTLPIFSKMTKKQQFVAFLVFFSFTLVFAVVAIVAYVIVMSPAYQQTALLGSKTELAGIVTMRRDAVLATFESRIKILNEAKRGDEAKRLSEIQDEFQRLVTKLLTAIQDGNLVIAHEVTKSIRALLDSKELDSIFTDESIEVEGFSATISGYTGEEKSSRAAPKVIVSTTVSREPLLFFRPLTVETAASLQHFFDFTDEPRRHTEKKNDLDLSMYKKRAE